jgi:hypothetical protein
MEKVQLEVEIKGGDSVAKASGKVENLKTKLRELKDQLASGTLSNGEFNKMAQEASELEDRIGDVNQRVKNLASDTGSLDGLVSIAGGIAGGFAAAQGAMALFGDENEDLQKQLVKIQGSVALLNGFQQVANTLNKDSAAMTLIQSTRLKILTAVQARYTAVVGTTTGAMKLLRIAGAALGIGLIIGAITLLIANFDKIKKVVTKFIPSLEQLGKAFTFVKNAITDFVGVTSDTTRGVDKLVAANEKQNKSLEKQIEILEAVGGKEEEIYRKKALMISNNILSLERQKLAGIISEEKYQEGIEEFRQEERVLQAKHNKQLEDANKKSSDKKVAIKKDEVQKIKEVQQDAQVTAYEEWKKQNDIEFEDMFNELAREQELDQKTVDINKAASDQILLNEATALEQRKQLLTSGLSALSDITTAFAGKQEAGQRRAFAINKALNISTAIIDTYMSAQKAYASQFIPLTPDSPIRGAIAAGASIAGGLARVAAISKTTFGSRSISSASGGGGGMPSGGNGSPQIRGFQTSNTSQEGGGGMDRLQVYVTETAIRNATNKVGSIYSQATVG